MESKQLKQAARVALKYRKDEQQPGGVVLVWAGQAYGWKNELRDPQSERPGALAVDTDGCVWIAAGGNDHAGAERWERAMEKNPLRTAERV